MADDTPAPASSTPPFMDRLKGYRTFAMSFIGATIVPIIVRQLKQLGIELTPDQQLQLAAAIMGLLMAAMRLVTDTAVGGAPRPIALNSENWLKHIDVKLLARLVIAETIRLRAKPAPAEASAPDGAAAPSAEKH